MANSQQSRISSVAAQSVALHNYITRHPGVDEQELMQQLGLPQITLYTFLKGLADDPEVCINGEFQVTRDGRKLNLTEIERCLETRKKTAHPPRQAERLLYLYEHLHSAIPDGGLTLAGLRKRYADLFERSGVEVPSQSALTRMIYRDLASLEAIDIAIDRPGTGSSKYNLRQSYLPKLPAESAAAVYVGMLPLKNTVLDPAISSAAREIEKAFFKRGPHDAAMLRQHIHVVNDTLARPEEQGDVFGRIIRALLDHHPVTVRYIKTTGEVADRVLEPLGMVCKRSVWYLIARRAETGEVRTYRIDQIEQAFVHERSEFTYPAGFSLAGHIGSSWGVYCNDEVQPVRLRFSPEVARRVTNLRYHHSQEIEKIEADGSVILRFTVCGLIELRSWILQWGEQVEVLEPPELRESVISAAQAVIDKYRRG